jgi:hypothetical protein
MQFDRNASLRRGLDPDDPAGIPPKILSSGRPVFLRGKVTFPSIESSSQYAIILLVHGQAEVSAIRFSPESPPALGKIPRESDALHLTNALTTCYPKGPRIKGFKCFLSRS